MPNKNGGEGTWHFVQAIGKLKRENEKLKVTISALKKLIDHCIYNKEEEILEKGGKEMANLVCTKCGKKVQATSTRLQKLVEKQGTLEKVKSSYLCQECRTKSKKVAKPAKETKKVKKSQESVAAQPKGANIEESTNEGVVVAEQPETEEPIN